jgi:4-hydroxy-3-methylbut-2-enyl diphosphate reductase
MNSKRVIVVNPHGFCPGVARAIETIETALRLCPAPVYCFNEIVHNQQIVNDLARRGVRFVKDLRGVPEGSTILFSAHGVSPSVRDEARQKNLRVIDATCPFVSKVHAEVRRYAREGYTVLFIGHWNHEEVIGVAGEAPDHVIVLETEEEARRAQPPDPTRVAVVTQTTLSVDKTRGITDILKSRFPPLRSPPQSDICYATQNRQRAVQALAGRVDLILVLGSKLSSNSHRLVEVGTAAGCRCVLISDLAELPSADLSAVDAVGITSGASTPELFLDQVLKDLAARGFDRVESLTEAEEDSLRFSLPRELQELAAENGRTRRRCP